MRIIVCGGGVKLSKAQAELLSGLPTYAAPSYAPAKKLVELGLAAWEARFCADELVLTDKGRAALTPEMDAR